MCRRLLPVARGSASVLVAPRGLAVLDCVRFYLQLKNEAVGEWLQSTGVALSVKKNGCFINL